MLPVVTENRLEHVPLFQTLIIQDLSYFQVLSLRRTSDSLVRQQFSPLSPSWRLLRNVFFGHLSAGIQGTVQTILIIVYRIFLLRYLLHPYTTPITLFLRRSSVPLLRTSLPSIFTAVSLANHLTKSELRNDTSELNQVNWFNWLTLFTASLVLS